MYGVKEKSYSQVSCNVKTGKNNGILLVLNNLIHLFLHMQESRALHYILGASLLMIAVFAISAFVMVNSQADTPTASTTVNNTNPTVASKFISTTSNAGTDGFGGGTIDLTAGTTRTVWINGLVADNNGEADISDVDITLRRSGVSAGCTEDANSCRVVSNCTLDAGAGTSLQVGYNCSIALNYYTDSTSTGGEFPAENWVLDVVANDLSAGTVTDSATTKEVETRLALTIPATIAYGSLALGTNTTAANNTLINIAQAGNDIADVEVSMAGTILQCVTSAVNTGTIPRANLIWSLTDVDYNGVGATALSGTATDTNLNVAYRHGANPTKDLFWNIQIPTTGVGGTCTGTVTVSTIAA